MPDVAQVEHLFPVVDGIRFHVAAAGPPAAPPVLLLHGFPQHWYAWRGVIPRLARTHRVLAVDLRGSGWSEAPARGYATADRVRDVLGCMAALGVERADVVGHDWGAWLGFRLALDRPGRVRRLVAISMAHPWPRQRHLAPRVWRWWVTALFEVPGLGELVLRTRPGVIGWLLSRDAARPGVWSPALRAAYARVAAEPARAAAGRRLHTALVVHDIPRLLLGRDRRRPFTTPTLVLVGDRDALLPARVLTPPPARAGSLTVRTVRGGHFVLDENPEEIAAAALAHLTASEPAQKAMFIAHDRT